MKCSVAACCQLVWRMGTRCWPEMDVCEARMPCALGQACKQGASRNDDLKLMM